MKQNISEIQKVHFFPPFITFHIFAPSQSQVVAGSRCNKPAHFTGRASVIPGIARSRNFQKACSLGVFWPSFQTRETKLNSRYHTHSPSCLPLPSYNLPGRWRDVWRGQRRSPIPHAQSRHAWAQEAFPIFFSWLRSLLPVVLLLRGKKQP